MPMPRSTTQHDIDVSHGLELHACGQSFKPSITTEVTTMFQPYLAAFTLIFAFLPVSTITPAGMPAPPAPVLISPASGAIMDNGCKPKADGITWDFDWSDVPNATMYHLRVWRSPGVPLINNMSVPGSSFNYVSAPHAHIINANLTGWRWTVRAKVHGVWGPWSRPRVFRVEKLNTDCP